MESVDIIDQKENTAVISQLHSAYKAVSTVASNPELHSAVSTAASSVSNVFNTLTPVVAPVAAGVSALSGVGIPLAVAIIVGKKIAESVKNKKELLRVFQIVETILKRCLLMLQYNITILKEYDSSIQQGDYKNTYTILSIRSLLENLYPSIFDSREPVKINTDKKTLCSLFKQLIPLIKTHTELENGITKKYFKNPNVFTQINQEKLNDLIHNLPLDVNKLIKNQGVYVKTGDNWEKGAIQKIEIKKLSSNIYTIKIKDKEVKANKNNIRIATDEPFLHYDSKYWDINVDSIEIGVEFFKECVQLINNDENYEKYINWPLLNKKDQTIFDILMLLENFNKICAEINNPSKEKSWKITQKYQDAKHTATLLFGAKRYKNDLIKFVTLINAHFISLNNRIEKYTGFMKTKLDMDEHTKQAIEKKIYDCPEFKVLIEDRHDNTYVDSMVENIKAKQQQQLDNEMNRINNLPSDNVETSGGGFTQKRRRRNRKSKRRNDLKRIKLINTRKNTRFNSRKTMSYRRSG